MKWYATSIRFDRLLSFGLYATSIAVTVAKESVRYIYCQQLLDSTLQSQMMFCCHSKCHMVRFRCGGRNGPLFPTSPGDSRGSNLKNITSKASSLIGTITVKRIRLSSHFELIIPWIIEVSIRSYLERAKYSFGCHWELRGGRWVELKQVSNCI